MAPNKVKQNARLGRPVFLQMVQDGGNMMFWRVHRGVEARHEGQVHGLLDRLVAQVKDPFVIDNGSWVMLEQIKGIRAGRVGRRPGLLGRDRA